MTERKYKQMTVYGTLIFEANVSYSYFLLSPHPIEPDKDEKIWMCLGDKIFHVGVDEGKEKMVVLSKNTSWVIDYGSAGKLIQIVDNSVNVNTD